MKLRQLVVASMSVLGVSLLSCSAFAADAQQTTTSTTPVSKHKVVHHRSAHAARHYVVHRHHMIAREHVYRDYRPMGCVPMQPCAAPCAVVPRCDLTQSILDGVAQAYGRSKPCPDWFNRIGISGGANFDAHWGNLAYGYMGENVNRLSVNDAYLNVHANVNDWTTAFASISFSDPSVRLSNFKTSTVGRPKLGKYSNVYNYAQDALVYTNANTNANSFSMEQAYVSFQNFNCFPVFLRLGKQYLDYGRYEIHPITRTMSQVLTETLRTSAELGFVTNCFAGLHGSIYAFQNPLRDGSGETFDDALFTDGDTASHGGTNWGASLGIEQASDPCAVGFLGGMGYDLGVGYMYNMIGVNDIQYAVSAHRASFLPFGGALSDLAQAYRNRVGSIAVYGDVMSGPFTLSGRYTQALQHFSAFDLSGTAGALSNGARPWAADLTGGYNFNCWMGRNQNVYLGYQASRSTVEVYLPKQRWLAGYNVDVWPRANVGLEYSHDTDYSVATGGIGGGTNALALRVGVKFG